MEGLAPDPTNKTLNRFLLQNCLKIILYFSKNILVLQHSKESLLLELIASSNLLQEQTLRDLQLILHLGTRSNCRYLLKLQGKNKLLDIHLLYNRNKAICCFRLCNQPWLHSEHHYTSREVTPMLVQVICNVHTRAHKI